MANFMSHRLNAVVSGGRFEALSASRPAAATGRYWPSTTCNSPAPCSVCVVCPVPDDDQRARNRAAHIGRPAQPLVREPRQAEPAQTAIDFVTRVVAAQQLDVRRQASAISVGRHPSRRLILLLARRLAQQSVRRIAPQRPVDIRQLHVFANQRIDRQSHRPTRTLPVAAAHESHPARDATYRRRALNRRLLTFEIHVPSGRNPSDLRRFRHAQVSCCTGRTCRSAAAARRVDCSCRRQRAEQITVRQSSGRHSHSTSRTASHRRAQTCHTPDSAE